VALPPAAQREGTTTTPQEAVMNRTQLFARCAATAAAATLITGLAAAPATSRPDPGEPASQQIQLDEGRTKAEIEHDEQLLLDGRTKAQIEHDEQLSVPSTDRDDVASAPDEFPWAAASLVAAGLVAVATGGVVMQRQRKTALAGA
jgi:hypothetical protein